MNGMKIATRFFIVGIIIAAIIILTISVGNILSSKGLMFANETVCESCWGTFICIRKIKLDPCQVWNGLILFYLLAVVFWLILFLIIPYLVEKYTNFNFNDWIKCK